MIGLVRLIPVQHRLAAAGIAIVVAGLIGMAAGAWIAAGHYQPIIDEAHKKIGELEHAYLTLATATRRQNDAIDALSAEARRRKKQAEQEAQRAHALAMNDYRLGAAVLSLSRPPGIDPCLAARQAFDDELRIERGKP